MSSTRNSAAVPNDAASNRLLGSWDAPGPWPFRNAVEADGKISAACPTFTTRKKNGMKQRRQQRLRRNA
jgi:hypothetical protein